MTLWNHRTFSLAFVITLLTISTLICSPISAVETTTGQELERLRQQATELLEKIEKLEESEKQVNTSPPDNTPMAAHPSKNEKGEEPTPGRGILELKSADTVLTVGGRIDMRVEWKSPAGDFRAGSAPLSRKGESNELTSNLRNSRLWLKSRTPTLKGELKALIETDFHGSSGTEINTNSHNLRLRHAYIQINGLKAGQTWSYFMFNVLPDAFHDPVHAGWLRQPLVSWTFQHDDLFYDISLENPESTLTDSSGDTVVPGDDQFPDLITQVRHYFSGGQAAASLMFRQIRQDRAVLSDGTELSTSDSTVGWGINTSAKLKTYGKDDLRAGLLYGKGIGRYIAFNAYDAGTIDDEGRIELQEQWAGYAAYRHWWSHNLRSSLTLSFAGTENNLSVVPETVNRSSRFYELNLFWTPVDDLQFGIAFANLRRELESGQTGKIDILTLSSIYIF